MRNKGSMLDYIPLMAIMLILGVFYVLGAYVKDSIYPALKVGLENQVDAVNIMNTTSAQFAVLDYIFMFFVIGFASATWIAAFYAKQHPVFVVFNIIVLVVLVIVAPAFSNMMRDFFLTSELTPYSAGGGGSMTFVFVTYFFRYLPLWIAGFGFILMIVGYAKG